MGVAATAGPGMSGSGPPPMPGGVHPGTVGPVPLGPGPGSSIGISSGGLASDVSVGMGAGSTGAGVSGTMPPLGLDFVKVRVCFSAPPFFRKIFVG